MFLFVAVALAGPTKAAEIEGGAKEFIKSLSDSALETLSNNDSDTEERAKKFRNLLRDHFAVRVIGKWVLGRYWRSANHEEKIEYLGLFEDFIVYTYVERFKTYAGVKLVIEKAIANSNKDVVVYTRMIRPHGVAPVKIAWRVRYRNEDYKIVDVMVEGISMGQTQRSEFASVIRKNGGHVKGLIKELRKMVSNDA